MSRFHFTIRVFVVCMLLVMLAGPLAGGSFAEEATPTAEQPFELVEQAADPTPEPTAEPAPPVDPTEEPLAPGPAPEIPLEEEVEEPIIEEIGEPVTEEPSVTESADPTAPPEVETVEPEPTAVEETVQSADVVFESVTGNGFIVRDDFGIFQHTLPSVAISVLNNDSLTESIADIEIQVVQIVSGPPSLVVECEVENCFVSPGIDFIGTIQFDYFVQSKFDSLAAGSARVTMEFIDLVATPVADNFTVQKNLPVALAILANDQEKDGPGDPLTVFSVDTTGLKGTLTGCVPSGECVYTPPARFVGNDRFTYTLSIPDPAGSGSRVATGPVVVSIFVREQASIANPDSATTDQDIPVTVFAMRNDVSPDGDPLFITLCDQPQHGSAKLETISGERACVYTPAPGFTGEDSFIYNLDDTSGTQQFGTVTITVVPPVEAKDDLFTTDYLNNAGFVVDPRGNDPGALADSSVRIVNVSLISGPQGASVTGCESGSCTVVAGTDFVGELIFSYQLENTSGKRGGAARVRVVYTDEPARGEADLFFTKKKLPVVMDLTANDADADQEPVVIQSFDTSGLVGTLSNCDLAVGCIYSPAPGFSGTERFRYALSIPDPAGSGTRVSGAFVTVTVVVQNEIVQAVNDVTETSEGVPVAVFPLRNDINPDGDPLTLVSCGSTSLGEVRLDESNGEPVCIFTPNPGFSGSAFFGYAVDDSGTQRVASVEVRVNEASSLPPVAVDDEKIVNLQGAELPVLRNDTDPEFGQLMISSFTQPRLGRVDCVEFLGATPFCLRLAFVPLGNIGQTVTFTYEVIDPTGEVSAPATVRITIVDEPGPVANDDAFTVEADRRSSIDVLLNDSPTRQLPLFVDDVEHGPEIDVTCNRPDPFGLGGCLLLVVQPRADFRGPTTLRYVAMNEDGEITNEATVQLDVTAPSNLRPLTTPDPVTVELGQSVLIDPLANDTDPEGGPMVFDTGFGQGVFGLVECVQIVLLDPSNPFTDYCTLIRYTANTTVGVDNFEYVALDSEGEIESGSIIVTIVESEPTPTVEPTETATPTEGPTETATPTEEPTATATPTEEPTQTATPTVDETVVASPTLVPSESPTTEPTPTTVPAETPTQAPSPTSVPTDVATEEPSPTADPPGIASPTAVPTGETTTPTPESDASPTAIATETTPETTSTDVPGNDGTPTAIPTEVPSETTTPTPVPSAEPTEEAEPTAVPTQDASPIATVTATPTAAASATPTPGEETSPTAEPTNEATPEQTPTAETTPIVIGNLPPDLVADFFVMPAGTTLTVDAPGVLANDSDPEGDPFTAVLLQQAQHGQLALAADGSFTYTPNSGFVGTDTFTYIAGIPFFDARLQSVRLDIALVTIDVQADVATPEVTPTAEPTDEPTLDPTATPTAAPTEVPTEDPTEEPVDDITPTVVSTAVPTEETTPEPSPTEAPTEVATEEPTEDPDASPTAEPTEEPIEDPEPDPTAIGGVDDDGAEDRDESVGGEETEPAKLPETGAAPPADGGIAWLAPLAAAVALGALGLRIRKPFKR